MLDMSSHFWPGERACQGKTSIYRGSLLLAYDHRYNLERAQGLHQIRQGHTGYRPPDGYEYPLNLPVLNAQTLAVNPEGCDSTGQPCAFVTMGVQEKLERRMHPGYR
jgi:hypothetical protein